ncbi:acetaldehyde dehydrogenase / alcohol dehydrogenase AdhE [Candidatus Koribacter versatilis Ellin345]|uniref:Aldehyde-alcohol dehydrogenase n=1 Tax=Koribacter versatilis (strain Ellin345) TaxID=204669 RepID=Q1IUR6_KORVE|nr:bifunctional acetaldehyde-CoA/alcohol dehydrogenase [Candidatus Koribacter versatilis]ABF39384.1 acetaldehyde dehydrogenase / alcohol dehydrogenase AdhE [Candidatus Koribacter versatilis Ellin345]
MPTKTLEEKTAKLSPERIAHLEGLVDNARAAASAFLQFTQEDVDRIVKQMVLAGMEHAQKLAQMAVEETMLGVLEDKVIKNMVATEFVYNYVKDKRTVGIIREYPERRLTEIAEPIGVIFSLIPITNPTSTVLFKCIMAIKTRNAVIFSPHPRAWRCCKEAVHVMYEAARKHGAPDGVFACLESHNLDDNDYLMHHKYVSMIDATGGPSAVKAAYSSGKPALGVGAGNTPVYLEKTADINMAVVDIITSKTFDNGTICASEQTVVIDDEIYDTVLKKFSDLGTHICNEGETELLGRTVIDPDTGAMQPMAVGQKAADIAAAVGIEVQPKTKLIIAPIKGVGPNHPLSVEKLFPVLAVYRAHSTEEALDVCVAVNRAGGLGHTAVIFSRNDDIIHRFGILLNAGRLIVNSPGSIGALGGVYNDMVPTFSFGCGTGGGNSTMDNVNVYHYLNIKRLARRTPPSMWFRIPNQIYFNPNSIQNLATFPTRSTVIVTNPPLEQMGHVDIVRRYIPADTRIHVLVIPDCEPELKAVMDGVEALNFYKADQIIALGGGSVIDAAKMMKLKYESPDANFEELGSPFLDLRKRVVQFPTEKKHHARLIAVPTTSGTGSEVTPFAVLFDKARQRKITLADYSLSPDVAIVDPQFVMSMPKGLTADTGIDCLTHALEAGVSNYASPYTDSNAMQAIRLAFKYLPIAYENPQDEEARNTMHNAATIAAIAFSNASVGLNHALAHAFGARFGVPHGRANALMLPHVIAFNAAVPQKFMPSPNQQGYVAHKKYAMIADLLGLPGHTVEEKVASLITAVEELLDRLNLPRSIASMGIKREDFESAMPELVKAAFEDPSWLSNPRMPLMSELQELFLQAYEGSGRKKAEAREEATVS